MILWVCFICLFCFSFHSVNVVLCIMNTLIDFQMLKHPLILGINPTQSCNINLSMGCWIYFASILLRFLLLQCSQGTLLRILVLILLGQILIFWLLKCNKSIIVYIWDIFSELFSFAKSLLYVADHFGLEFPFGQTMYPMCLWSDILYHVIRENGMNNEAFRNLLLECTLLGTSH